MFHCALSCLFGLCGDYDNGVFVFFFVCSVYTIGQKMGGHM